MIFEGRSISRFVFTTLLALSLSGPAFAQEGANECTLATLSGLYVFNASGFAITPAGAALPKAVVEFLTFDGNGHLTSVATANVNGNLIAHFLHGTGATYTVNPDCTGTLTFNPNLNFDLYIASGGEEIHMIQTDHLPSPGAGVLAGVAKRISNKSQ